jgi:hypothetical protein
MTKTFWLYAVLATAMVGCALQPPGSEKSPCNTATCHVDVAVSGTAPNITVSVDPVTLRLATGNHGADGNGVTLVWQLRATGYEFKDDSIQFYDPNSPRQFDRAGTGGSGAQYHIRDRNNDGKKWGYLIKVYDRSTGYWYVVDPWIQNG